MVDVPLLCPTKISCQLGKEVATVHVTVGTGWSLLRDKVHALNEPCKLTTSLIWMGRKRNIHREDCCARPKLDG